MSDLKLDLSPLEGAVRSLGNALGYVGDDAYMSTQPEAVQETLRAGLIQNVEFVFEICTKMLKRRLELDGRPGTDVERATFRGLIRLAFEASLLEDPLPWFKYREMRNTTSHTYEKEKAKEVVRNAPAFLADAMAVLSELQRRNGDD